jgi:glycerol-3-phosphate cytidylyltransferase/D-beta-D-heptose 7-phosphate kinase/D-beta-D-heptose 1-phosphate adenosyltransferase
MKVVMTSGYFNPLHGGHLDLIENARSLGDKLILIVNNDKQQMLKKGKIILDEQNRLRLVRSLKNVDEAVLSVDETSAVSDTLAMIAVQHPGDQLIFAKGGDRAPSQDAIPESEVEVGEKYGIEIIYGVGGYEKADSSTRINQALGLQD